MNYAFPLIFQPKDDMHSTDLTDALLNNIKGLFNYQSRKKPSSLNQSLKNLSQWF